MKLIDRTLHELNGLASLLEELNHGYEGGAHIVITLGKESLLDKSIKTLHILLVDDLSQDAQRVGLDHVVVALLDVLAQARDDDEHLILIDLELLDEDIDEPP